MIAPRQEVMLLWGKTIDSSRKTLPCGKRFIKNDRDFHY